jgi:molybdenum cofactor cytidylyltransferase
VGRRASSSHRSRDPCWALLLAAGQSCRFGGDKLLAPLEGRPLIQHVLKAITTAVHGGVLTGGVVVVRAGSSELAELAREAGLDIVENHAPESGFARSLRLGLAALRAAPAGFARSPEPGSAAMLFLGDQPLVEGAVILKLAREWREGAGKVIRPRYAERPAEPGHPVLLDRSVWPLAEGLSGDAGLGSLLKARPELVAFVDQPGKNPDIDTRADLAALERQLAESRRG